MTEEAEKPTSPQDEERRAIDMIARTPEGILLHRYLRRELEFCPDGIDGGTLLGLHGRRSLARDLMRHMASGIEATGAKNGGSGSADAAILNHAGGAVRVRPDRRGAGRRITADTIVPGYDVSNRVSGED